MKKLFGTDGMRGEAGKFPLDAVTVKIVGHSLAEHLAEKTNGRKPRIVIGRDTRESGEWIEKALIAGAMEAGAECESAGVITTPGVAFLARMLPADAGVVISASHNPYQDNGIKIFSPTGKKLDDATERSIEADIYAANNESESDSATDISINENLQERYLDYLTNEFSNLSLNGLRIVVDCANGASSYLAPRLFENFGATVIAINDTPDGQNINRDCGSLYIEGLQAKVVEEKANLGVAFDGDADRALFVDSHGEFVDGDAYMFALGCFMQERDELVDNTIVATTMSNLGLEAALRDRGIKLLRTDVGDKYVLEELLRTNTSIGGEQSGHIIFPKRSLAGDGMLTTLCLLEAMQEKNAMLEDLTKGFTRYPQILVNVRVKEKVPFNDVTQIAKAAKEVETQLGENGRLLLRYSGTEALARVMIEGESQNEIERLANNLAATIKEALG
jgi:phosphoglucosamine mutase